MREILILIGFWAIYFSIHSLLAGFWLKSKLASSFPAFYRHYRIVYNIISLLGLVAILFYLATTPSTYLFNKNEGLQFLGLALSTWGLVFLRLAFKQYSWKEFLGVGPNERDQSPKLAMGGILEKVRHPIYTGTLLIVGGFFLFNPKVLNLVTMVCVIVYILIGMVLEERKLEKEFGDQYRQYKERVPGLIPRFGRRKEENL